MKKVLVILSLVMVAQTASAETRVDVTELAKKLTGTNSSSFISCLYAKKDAANSVSALNIRECHKTDVAVYTDKAISGRLLDSRKIVLRRGGIITSTNLY